MKLTYSLLKQTVSFEWTPDEQREMTNDLLERTAGTFARLVHVVRRHPKQEPSAAGFGDDHIDVAADEQEPLKI